MQLLRGWLHCADLEDWVAVARQALGVFIANVAYNFIAIADDVVRAVALRAAATLAAVGVSPALLVAVEEVAAAVLVAAAREALKVVVARVAHHLHAVQADLRVHAVVVRAAVRCRDAVLVALAEYLLGDCGRSRSKISTRAPNSVLHDLAALLSQIISEMILS